MVLDLADGHCLVFTANHLTAPLAMNGDIDWGRVHRIRILSIERDNAAN